VDYMEASHWHSDHTGSAQWQSNARGWNAGLKGCFRSGFGLAAEFLHFGKAIDRGYPDYDDPIPTPDGDLTPLGHMKRLYAALRERDGLTVEKFRLGARDQIVPLKGPVDGFSVFNLCAKGEVAMRDGSVRIVYGDLFENGRKPRGLNENGMSLGHIVRYGRFSYYTAGDFSDHRKMADGSTWMIEEAMAKAVGHVNVAKMNHHGHHSMPDALVRALCPQVWTACVWDQLHTVPETLARTCDPKNYPDGRLPAVMPSVFPDPRTEREATAPYFAGLEPACLKTGCHVVITVPPSATAFRVDCVSARDEAMSVVASHEYPL
ncbi:MAG: MBL fold metallo-hydrolase, partial [bacterium]|nr:MBL fold metallo-hydrolase [Candidatus Colisoma equi]